MKPNAPFFGIALGHKKPHTGDGRFSPEKNPKLTNLEKDHDTQGLPTAQPTNTQELCLQTQIFQGAFNAF